MPVAVADHDHDHVFVSGSVFPPCGLILSPRREIEERLAIATAETRPWRAQGGRLWTLDSRLSTVAAVTRRQLPIRGADNGRAKPAFSGYARAAATGRETHQGAIDADS
jgi:hypothetical protein